MKKSWVVPDFVAGSLWRQGRERHPNGRFGRSQNSPAQTALDTAVAQVVAGGKTVETALQAAQETAVAQLEMWTTMPAASFSVTTAPPETDGGQLRPWRAELWWLIAYQDVVLNGVPVGEALAQRQARFDLFLACVIDNEASGDSEKQRACYRETDPDGMGLLFGE